MKDKKNLWHLTWVIGMYAVLVAMFLLVIEYKVKWENKDLNTYLYFYSCSGELCTTTNTVSDYYGRAKCEKKNCPYIREKKANYVVLATESKEYVFDYLNDKIISDTYMKYTFTEDSIIFKDKDNKQGVMSLDGEILIEANYNRIDDYKDGYLAYAENGKVGIINNEKNINIAPNYEEVIIIDDDKYAYLEDGKYYVASYDTELPVNNYTYDFIYAAKGKIFTIKDRKIDIVNSDLNSQLLLKIDTEYEYHRVEERNTLNLYTEANLLHFTVFKNNDYTNYIFDLKNNKLFY